MARGGGGAQGRGRGRTAQAAGRGGVAARRTRKGRALGAAETPAGLQTPTDRPTAFPERSSDGVAGAAGQGVGREAAPGVLTDFFEASAVWRAWVQPRRTPPTISVLQKNPAIFLPPLETRYSELPVRPAKGPETARQVVATPWASQPVKLTAPWGRRTSARARQRQQSARRRQQLGPSPPPCLLLHCASNVALPCRSARWQERTSP